MMAKDRLKKFMLVLLDDFEKTNINAKIRNSIII